MKRLICNMIYTVGKWMVLIFIIIIIILGINREQLRTRQSALEGKIDKLLLEIYELRVELDALKYNQVFNAEKQIMGDDK